MNATYQNLKLSKALYKSARPFSEELELLDPSSAYTGELAGLDAFQRQLKRFDIRVSGPKSDLVQKFFATSDSAYLFPEYVARAVGQGMDDAALIDQMIAAKTEINSLDYRSIVSDLSEEDKLMPEVAEGAAIPTTTIALSDQLVKLKKRGRMLVASYEAIRYQRLDVVTVAISQSGSYIARAQLKDAVDALTGGLTPSETASSGKLLYTDLLKLWSSFGDYELNTLIASPAMAGRLLALPEMQDSVAGLTFHGTGKLITPLGAQVIRTAAVADDLLIGLDRRFALEMVTAGGVQVDYDRLIDTQLERAAVTSTAGFAKLFPDAVHAIKLKA